MNEIEAAYKILEVLKGKNQIITLRELAKLSGFKEVTNNSFKKGFNLLQKKHAVRLRQSGWPSEHRGGNNHPKTVLLISDVYAIENAEQELISEMNPNIEYDSIKIQPDWNLMPVMSIFSERELDISYINKDDYDNALSSKDGKLNFWEPLIAKDRRKVGLKPLVCKNALGTLSTLEHLY